MTKAVAMMSFIRQDAEADRLALSTRPRTVETIDRDSANVEFPNAFPQKGREGEHFPSADGFNMKWERPPETLGDMKFQGVKGGDDPLLEATLLKGNCDDRPEGTMQEPRAVQLHANTNDSGRMTGSRHLSTTTTESILSGERKLGSVTVGELKDKAKDAMMKTNYSVAASLTRLALVKGVDPALA